MDPSVEGAEVVTDVGNASGLDAGEDGLVGWLCGVGALWGCGVE